VHGMTLASTSDNAAHGYNLTFAFPMILFIVIATALYLLYSRPHKVPGHGALRGSGGGAGVSGGIPEAGAARAAATAVGFSTAAGGGAAELPHEPVGAHRAASADEGSGNVSEDENQAAADDASSDTPSTAASPATEDEANE
jgi:hypothetical protein